MSLRRTGGLALTLLVLAPAGAAAQSAGDEQYSDPFAGEEAPAAERTAAPAPTAAPTRAPAAAAVPAAPAAPAPAPAALPRTGADAGVLAAAGTALVLAGVALRLRVR